MIDTKKVARRAVAFTSLEEILADAEAHGGPDAPTTGNWTAAQIVQHVTALMTRSLDGFEFALPLPMRLFGRLIRSRALRQPPPAGFRIRGSMAPMMPEPDVTWDEAIGGLRGVVERVLGGDRMTFPSPLVGALDHEQWVQLHCRHAELHFGYLAAR